MFLNSLQHKPYKPHKTSAKSTRCIICGKAITMKTGYNHWHRHCTPCGKEVLNNLIKANHKTNEEKIKGNI